MSKGSELQDAALALIRELPDDAARLRPSQVKAIGDLQHRIGETMLACAAADENMLAIVESRNPAPDVPIGEYLSEAERAIVEASSRRYLDAERANAALGGWKDRSGYMSRVEAFAGEKLPRPEVPHMEEPDGTIVCQVLE